MALMFGFRPASTAELKTVCLDLLKDMCAHAWSHSKLVSRAQSYEATVMISYHKAFYDALSEGKALLRHWDRYGAGTSGIEVE